jgi:hypothetical protein
MQALVDDMKAKVAEIKLGMGLTSDLSLTLVGAVKVAISGSTNIPGYFSLFINYAL